MMFWYPGAPEDVLGYALMVVAGVVLWVSLIIGLFKFVGRRGRGAVSRYRPKR